MCLGVCEDPFPGLRRLEMLLRPPSPRAFLAGPSPGDPLPAGTRTCVGPPHRTPGEQSRTPSRGISGGASAPPTRCWEARGVCLGPARCGVLDLPLQGCLWVQAPGHRAGVTVSCPWGTVPGSGCLSEIRSMDEDAPGTWAVVATYQPPDRLRKGTPALCLPRVCCPRRGSQRGDLCPLEGRLPGWSCRVKGAGNAPFRAILCRIHRENDFSKAFD